MSFLKKYDKATRVIASCIDEKQLKHARKYAELLLRDHSVGDSTLFFRELNEQILIKQRQLVIED